MQIAREQDLHRDSRLPSVRELAERYGVAKATVQQAIRQLVSEGLCYAVDRKGLFLAQDPPAPTVEAATVALVLSYERHSEETNPFYRSLYAGAEAEAVCRKHNVLSLYEWRGKDPLQKNREVEQFRRQLAGFLALAIYEERDCLRLRDSGVPVVAVDYETRDLGIDCVVIDNPGAMRMLCERVLKDKPGRVFLADVARGSDYDPAIGERHRAFRAALNAAGTGSARAKDDVILLAGGLGTATGPGALLETIAGGGERPAVICTDEYAAGQLLTELGPAGPRPGRDFLLAYLGFLEPQLARMRDLPAIICAIDFRELGREGMRLLGDRIATGPGRAIRRTVGGKVVEWQGGAW